MTQPTPPDRDRSEDEKYRRPLAARAADLPNHRTARHELSHAAAAMMEGADITEVCILPTIHPFAGFLWGYVNYSGGHPSWLTMAAPYICDVLTFAVFAPICVYVRRSPRWLWINCFVIGVASPLLNVLYNYQKVFTRDSGDVNVLLLEFPAAAVHTAFLGLIALFGIGAWFVIRSFARSQP
jgi:hypothetical protein